MPRKKVGGYALADDGAGGLTPIRADVHRSGVSDVSGLQNSEARDSTTAVALAQIDTRDDGWLRFIPSGDSKQCYAKFKFNRGEHSGRYVMFVAPAGDFRGAIIGLALKLLDVDEGKLRPAHDTFYDPR